MRREHWKWNRCERQGLGWLWCGGSNAGHFVWVTLVLATVLAWCALPVTAQDRAGKVGQEKHAQRQGDVFPRMDIASPYLGDPKKYHVPLDGKPTLVMLVEVGQSLTPMEVIRGLRVAGAVGERLAVAIVLVGGTAEGYGNAPVVNEQLGLLGAGLRSSVAAVHLSDPARVLWAALGKPALPHVMLVSAEGKISGREMFLGSLAVEQARIEACLAGREYQAAKASVEADDAKSPIFRAVAGARALARGERDDRGDELLGLVRRVDCRSIVNALKGAHNAKAEALVRAYVERTTNFSLARGFAQAALEEFGPARAGWARDFLDTRAEGYVFADAYGGRVTLRLANGSDSLDMFVSVRLKLTSRWNGQVVAEVDRSYTLRPGSSFSCGEQAFAGRDAGWGDYRIDSSINATMQAGRYPDMKELPTVRRTSACFELLVPRNEFAEEETPETSGRFSADDRAFRAGLEDSLWRLRQKADAPKKVDVSGIVSAIAGAASPRQQPAESKPFSGLKIGRWLQGQEGSGAVEADGVVRGFGGRVVLVDFMFVSCPPCRALLPKLSELAARYGERGLTVVSVAPTWGAKGLVGLIEQTQSTHAFAELGEGEDKRWGVTAFPTLFLIDRKGVVRQSFVGSEPTAAMIEKLLDEAK